MARQKLFILIIAGIILSATFTYAGTKDTVFPKEIIGKDSTPMVLIPAGDFVIGRNDGNSDEKPAHKAYTDAFYMDKYEVTSAQYAKFLNEYESHLKMDSWGDPRDLDNHTLIDVTHKYCLIERIDNTFRPKSGYENHPIICVTWYGALAYAQYYGQRLPTEVEWEKAARGGLVGKKYPWGNAEPNGTQCNFADYITSYDKTSKVINDGYAVTAPVGSYTPNGYGLYDMAGNVWEWCADWYGYYPNIYERNSVGPASGEFRVLRGGAFNSALDYLHVTYRFSRNPDHSLSYIGFRCAQDTTP